MFPSPLAPGSPPESHLGRSIVLVAGATFLLAAGLGGAAPRVRAQIAEAVMITVHADEPTGAVEPRVGLLHGLDGSATVDEARIAALRPRHWRLGKWETYDMAARQPGLDITFGLGSLYRWIKGPDDARPWEDWAEWEGLVQAVIRTIDQRYPESPPAYFDLWPEPNIPYFWRGSYEQLLEAFARAALVIDEQGSTARLVGPSVSAYSPGAPGVAGVVDFVADLEARHGVRLDAVSWHEFVGWPEGIPGRAARLRRDLDARLAPGPTPELHVNEHLYGPRHLSPGFNVGYLYYFEQAAIDRWSRACWNVRERRVPDANPETYGGCWAGQNGLLLRDGRTPQPAWWVYKAYVDGEGGQRLRASSQDERVVALADRHDESQRIRLLVGRYGRSGSAKVTLRVAGWPYAGSHAVADVSRIPQGAGATADPPLATGLPDGPEPAGSQLVRVERGWVTVSIPALREGDAYVVELRPAEWAVVPRLVR